MLRKARVRRGCYRTLQLCKRCIAGECLEATQFYDRLLAGSATRDVLSLLKFSSFQGLKFLLI